MIKTITSVYYDGKDNGIILDDAYDLYKRNEYLKYVKENSVNYLRCQDVDMNLLAFFPDIEFITIPDEAENIEGVYNIKKLKGLEITARNLELLDLSRFSWLEYLIIHDHSDIESIKSISVDSELETLHLEFCYGLKTLDGVQSFSKLNKLVLDYCLKLEDISAIMFCAHSMKHFRITDCNKIKELTVVLSNLFNLETLYLSACETNRTNILSSVKFIQRLKELKDFMTDYKIEDGDLTPLLKVNNVEILKFYKHYNLDCNMFIKNK